LWTLKEDNVRILTTSTSEGDLIWKQSLGRFSQVEQIIGPKFSVSSAINKSGRFGHRYRYTKRKDERKGQKEECHVKLEDWHGTYPREGVTKTADWPPKAGKGQGGKPTASRVRLDFGFLACRTVRQ
jgi:hypothetical protein